MNTITKLGICLIVFYSLTQIFNFIGISTSTYSSYAYYYVVILLPSLSFCQTSEKKIDNI